jgi:hypothetical protein
LKWVLIGGFCILFALAAIFLARKPVAIVVSRPDEPAAQAISKQPTTGTAIANASPTSSTNGNSLAALDRDTAHSLDALKDQLFRLELRRQAGTIGDEEYSRERARAEQVLRDLVRG